jgi:transposase
LVVKTAERELARVLRRAEGLSVKEIAHRPGVSRSSASVWVRDVPLTFEQRATLLARNPAYNRQQKGASTNAERAFG